MKTRKEKIEEMIEQVIQYEQQLDRILFDRDKPYIMKYKEFLIDAKIKECTANLLEEKEIHSLVVENSYQSILGSQLLLEWEKYKGIPRTNLTYRYDRGMGIPGSQDHIHVYLGKTKNQVYAINIDGTPHDGSKAKLGKKEIDFLKDIGFTPPKDGLLEWMTLDPSKEYVVYKVHLLLS